MSSSKPNSKIIPKTERSTHPGKRLGKKRPIKKRVKRVRKRTREIRKKVHDKRVVLAEKVRTTGRKMKERTVRSPWLARLAALVIGILDGTVIILFKLGMNLAGKRIGGDELDVLSGSFWYHVIINPYVIIGTLIAIISILGMTGAFSHERSHRLFSVIGGTSYITIVVGSVLVLHETVETWVMIGVGIILISLFISNLYHCILWFKDKVKYISTIR